MQTLGHFPWHEIRVCLSTPGLCLFHAGSKVPQSGPTVLPYGWSHPVNDAHPRPETSSVLIAGRADRCPTQNARLRSVAASLPDSRLRPGELDL